MKCGQVYLQTACTMFYRNTIAKEEEASEVRDEKRESVTEKLETKLMLNSFGKIIPKHTGGDDVTFKAHEGSRIQSVTRKKKMLYVNQFVPILYFEDGK